MHERIAALHVQASLGILGRSYAAGCDIEGDA